MKQGKRTNSNAQTKCRSPFTKTQPQRHGPKLVFPCHLAQGPWQSWLVVVAVPVQWSWSTEVRPETRKVRPSAATVSGAKPAPAVFVVKIRSTEKKSELESLSNERGVMPIRTTTLFLLYFFYLNRDVVEVQLLGGHSNISQGTPHLPRTQGLSIRTLERYKFQWVSHLCKDGCKVGTRTYSLLTVVRISVT